MTALARRSRRTLNVRRMSVFMVFACAVGCAQGSGSVTRMVDGVRYEGRFINPEAYAAFLLGVEREERADYAGALAAYREAHAEDPDSPEIQVKIGAMRCQSSEAPKGPAAAQTAFENAAREDPDYYGIYFERARCAARAGDNERALPDAEAAVARHPSDEPANVLVAHLLERLGRSREARAWLEAFQIYYGRPARVGRALNGVRGARTTTLGRGTQLPPRAPSAAFAELRSGRAERARERASRELDADPSDADAWVATLVACDALRDELCFATTLDSLKTPSLAPSATALGYLRDLLARRTGAQPQF